MEYLAGICKECINFEWIDDLAYKNRVIYPTYPSLDREDRDGRPRDFGIPDLETIGKMFVHTDFLVMRCDEAKETNKPQSQVCNDVCMYVCMYI